MQKVSIGLARSIWLFDINDLNPSGKNIFPDVLSWLGDKYAFQNFPKSVAEMDQDKKGFLFKAGQFQTGEGSITVNFSLYNDGVVAETWASTEKGDQFLEDILQSSVLKYGLTKPSQIRKQYVSEVVVRLDNPLSNLNPKLSQFSETLSGIFKQHNLPSFETTGVVFGLDSSATSYKPPGFGIERKVGAPFSDNRFWSKSPFTTSEHLRVIEEFEKLLAENKSAATS
jgi:hypothetical protein